MKKIVIDLSKKLKIPPAKVIHKNYLYKGWKLLFCSSKLAANYNAPLRARSTRQWRYVSCKKCLHNFNNK